MQELDPPSTAARLIQDLPRQLERMHRRFLDVVRLELGRVGVRDISPVQVLMLSNIGKESISVRDLIERGYYLGSNASYNLKNLVEGGYVDRIASKQDRRSALLKITPKGLEVLRQLTDLEQRWAAPLLDGNEENAGALEITHRFLRDLERCWSDAARYTGDDGGEEF